MSQEFEVKQDHHEEKAEKSQILSGNDEDEEVIK
jgi:hypothetical protein